jgi:hypothetical protein
MQQIKLFWIIFIVVVCTNQITYAEYDLEITAEYVMHGELWYCDSWDLETTPGPNTCEESQYMEQVGFFEMPQWPSTPFCYATGGCILGDFIGGVDFDESVSWTWYFNQEDPPPQLGFIDQVTWDPNKYNAIFTDDSWKTGSSYFIKYYTNDPDTQEPLKITVNDIPYLELTITIPPWESEFRAEDLAQTPPIEYVAEPYTRRLKNIDSNSDRDCDNRDGYTLVDLRNEPCRNKIGVEYIGNSNHETVYGTICDDEIYTYSGSDWVDGNLGDDVINGGTEIGYCLGDILFGNGGEDYIYGNGGDDDILGGDQDDHLYGGAGHDNMYGDNLDACQWSDSHNPNAGDDWIYGNDGNDTMYGCQGSDHIYGGSDDDYLMGNYGNDFLFGEADDDDMFGGFGNDYIYDVHGECVKANGGDGNDEIYIANHEYSSNCGILDYIDGGGQVDDDVYCDCYISTCGYESEENYGTYDDCNPRNEDFVCEDPCPS